MNSTSLKKSGDTLSAPRIEEPKREFFVAFDAPAYFNLLRLEAGRRWVRVLAETPEGAMKVIQHHYFNANDFEFLSEKPNQQ